MLRKGKANMAGPGKAWQCKHRVASHGEATKHFITRKHKASDGRANIAFHNKLWQAMAGQVIAWQVMGWQYKATTARAAMASCSTNRQLIAWQVMGCQDKGTTASRSTKRAIDRMAGHGMANHRKGSHGMASYGKLWTGK